MRSLRQPCRMSEIDDGRAPPAWGEHNVHLWWCPTPPEQSAPPLRRARIDALLRRVLAPYLEVEPGALRFGREARGRPYLLGPQRDGLLLPDFNLSDTDGGSVVAVAPRGRVGVDLERIDRQLPHRKLAQRYFHGREAAMLEAMDDEAARVAFLRLWTCKESSCKSTGTGIYGQLDRWVFEAEGDAPRLLALPPEAGAAADWHHLRATPAPGYSAVLACQGWVPVLRRFALDLGE